ncbi:hypothetical protein ACOBQJ_00970 [Pelotomaculum propionicicum]
MLYKNNQITWTDAEILMAIATFQENGSTEDDIIKFVDWREHMILTDTELSGGLKRLNNSCLIEQRTNKYYIAENFIKKLPCTLMKRISYKKRDWCRLLNIKI